MSSTDTDTDEITKKKEEKAEGNVYVKVSEYIVSCLTQIAFFMLYLLIFGSITLFNCKIAQSGILSKLMSNDSYCSPFINKAGPLNSDHSDPKDLKNAIFSSARNMKTDANYIATDQISFIDQNYKYDIWGKIISFDYVENVIKGLGTTHGSFVKAILGYDVEENIIILRDSYGNETYAGLLSSFYSIVRSIVSYDFVILNSIFTVLNYLPEALLFILPAMIPIYFTTICYTIGQLILLFNIIIAVVFVIIHWLQFVKYMFFYFWSLTNGWPVWKVVLFASSSFLILFLCALLFGILVLIVLFIFIFCYSIIIWFISNLILLYVVIWPAVTFKAKMYKLVHARDNIDATSSIQGDFTSPDSLEHDIKKFSVRINSKDEKINNDDKLTFMSFEKEYGIWTLFVQNLYYKMNWIVLALTIIMLINVGVNFSVYGINVILIIIFFIFVLTITSRNERVNELHTGKLFGVHKYVIDDMIVEGMIPITSDYTAPYSDNYKCVNNYKVDGFVPSHITNEVIPLNQTIDSMISSQLGVSSELTGQLHNVASAAAASPSTTPSSVPTPSNDAFNPSSLDAVGSPPPSSVPVYVPPNVQPHVPSSAPAPTKSTN